MAGKGRPSAQKRRIDKLRQEQQAAKRERRHSRDRAGGDAEDAPGGATEEELLERFRLLNEARAAGTVTDEQFEPARHEIMVALGIEEPRADDGDEDDEDA